MATRARITIGRHLGGCLLVVVLILTLNDIRDTHGYVSGIEAHASMAPFPEVHCVVTNGQCRFVWLNVAPQYADLGGCVIRFGNEKYGQFFGWGHVQVGPKPAAVIPKRRAVPHR